MDFQMVVYSVNGCGRAGIKPTCAKGDCDWVINPWTHIHRGSELSFEISSKPQ